MAAIPPIPTFTTSEVLVSSDMNKIATALSFLLTNRPLAKAHQTVAQTFVNVTAAFITFDTVDIDTDAGFTGTGSGTDRYVCRTTGWYAVKATVSYATNNTGARLAVVLVNGVQQNSSTTEQAVSTAVTTATVSELIKMNAGDYLQVQGYQDSGVSINTVISPVYQASSVSLQFALSA